MPRTPLLVQVRPLAEAEIGFLEQHLAADFAASDKHRRRLARQQAGDVVYLVAWYDDLPVGHVLVVWGGPPQPELASMRDSPELEDLYVGAPFRSRSVGSQLLTAAEVVAVRRGFARVGLAVGVDNPRARALYERRGYRDAGLGVYQNRWTTADRTGHVQWHEETCTYMTKVLPAPMERRRGPGEKLAGH